MTDPAEAQHRYLELRRTATWLLSHTLRDLKSRALSDDEYMMLGMAGVLRRTLLDQHAVAHLARDKSLPAPVFNYRESQPWPDPHRKGLWLPEPGQFRSREVSGTLKQFRAASIANALGSQITVDELIRHFAHVEGGVHIGHADNEKEKTMRAVFKFRTDGWRHGLDLLADIAYVTVTGLEPLVAASSTT